MSHPFTSIIIKASNIHRALAKFTGQLRKLCENHMASQGPGGRFDAAVDVVDQPGQQLRVQVDRQPAHIVHGQTRCFAHQAQHTSNI